MANKVLDNSDTTIQLLIKTLENLNIVENQYKRPEGTAIISQSIRQSCRENGLICTPEVEISVPQEERDRLGIVDFIIKAKEKKYAVELDSANKKFSLTKLLFLAENGYEPVWIRWWHPIKMDIPESINLLDYTPTENIHRRKRTRKRI